MPKCQMPKSKVQSPNAKMPNAKCQMPNAKCQMPNAKRHKRHKHQLHSSFTKRRYGLRQRNRFWHLPHTSQKPVYGNCQPRCCALRRTSSSAFHVSATDAPKGHSLKWIKVKSTTSVRNCFRFEAISAYTNNHKSFCWTTTESAFGLGAWESKEREREGERDSTCAS